MSQKKPTEILDITIADLEDLTDEHLELITGGGIIVHEVNSTTPISFDLHPEPTKYYWFALINRLYCGASAMGLLAIYFAPQHPLLPT